MSVIGHVMHLSLAAALSRPTCPNCGSVYVPVDDEDEVVARCPNDADKDCHYAAVRSLVAAIRANPAKWPAVVDAVYKDHAAARAGLLEWGEHLISGGHGDRPNEEDPGVMTDRSHGLRRVTLDGWSGAPTGGTQAKCAIASAGVLADAIGLEFSQLDHIATGVVIKPWSSELDAMAMARRILREYVTDGLSDDTLLVLARDDMEFDRRAGDAWPTDPDGIVEEVLAVAVDRTDCPRVRGALAEHRPLVLRWLDDADSYRAIVEARA
jgi:hypothetical protein